MACPGRTGTDETQGFIACEEIAVVQAFRPAVSGGPERPHYIRNDFFTGSSALRIRHLAALANLYVDSDPEVLCAGVTTAYRPSL